MGEFDTAPWMRWAACKGEDADLFFPDRGQSLAPAREFCDRCPVQNTCLEYALTHKLKHGVWGGHSEASRRQIVKLRARRTA